MSFRSIIVFFLFQISFVLVNAQEEPNKALSHRIKYKIDESSSIAFHFGTQVWARYMQTNPGTFDMTGQYTDEFFDIALRRTRFSMLGTFADNKFVVYTQLGMNGQTFSSGAKPQIYFHDVWSAFNLAEGKIFAGVGLHGWSGISRLASVSYNSNIMLDHPGFNLPNLGKTDQSGRQLGMFIKGNLAKINYRVAIDKPFICDETDDLKIEQSVYAPKSNMAYSGYAFYAFLDEEEHKSSYVKMSYLGAKKIFNLGAGFDYQSGLMVSLQADSAIQYHDKKLFGIDLFLDYPFSNKSVLTLYSVMYFYDFGPNHISTYAAMNPLKNGDLAQGGGSAHYNVGSGNIFYGMIGFMLPEKLQPFSGKLQPVVAMHYKDFEALREASIQFDVGINYYISGHSAKLNLQYSNWAVYTGDPGLNSTSVIDTYKSMWVFQVQLYL